LISENEKSYIICNECSKQENCSYYKDIKETSERYINTPLNVHFINCKDYESALFAMVRRIETEQHK
jgi:hypothetical protein